MQIALKVDVDTYRGTVEGVPALLDLFARYKVPATFLFSLGPDHTGRALRRIFRPGFLRKVQRTSVASHYGYKTLMYGVLLPGPHIARNAGEILRQTRAVGHEVGIHCYDHVRWQDFVAKKNRAWTEREMRSAYDAFVEAFGENPTTIGAAGWQLNEHVIELEEQMGFAYASDVRGEEPFYPKMQSRHSQCVQIPTTLPTLDELLGRDGIDESNVAEQVLAASRTPATYGHVYTLHAELEGMKLLPVMEKLLQQWQSQGDTLVSLEGFYRTLPLNELPSKEIVWGEVEGRSGLLALEG